jgi:hypothetical protein
MPATLQSAQQLLVQGVVASTLQLVRSVRDGHEPLVLRGLMLERRRMLAALAPDEVEPGQSGVLWALRAAVAESDRTLETLFG